MLTTIVVLGCAGFAAAAVRSLLNPGLRPVLADAEYRAYVATRYYHRGGLFDTP